MCLFPKREFIYLQIAQLSTASTRTILIEAVSSIPYLVRNWDLSSSVKSKISEAGLYNIVPNFLFYHNKCALFRCFDILK
jgi:hypothetical protein